MEKMTGRKMMEMTAGMKQWRVRVALEDEGVMAARGSLLARLKELVGGGAATLLVAHVVGEGAHFNALEQLSRLGSKQGIWSAVMPAAMARGVKQLLVHVPLSSSAEEVATAIQRIAETIGLELALNETRCDGSVPHFVVDTLIATALMHELEAFGCTMFGDLAEYQVVLSSDVFASHISTVALPRIEWHYDPYRQSCSIEMTCIPAIMKLKTIAEDHEIDDSSADECDVQPSWSSTSRVRVLPRMSECWVVSRMPQGAFTSSITAWGRESRNDVTQLPSTDEEFRSYWLQVHGIRLPEHFGGYARVRFSSKSIITYPACCVMTEWLPLVKQTRLEGLDVVRGFAALMRQLFGPQSVSVSSPNDQKDKSAVLLPASALLNAQPAESSYIHRTPSQLPKPQAKRRMVSRDRYAAA